MRVLIINCVCGIRSTGRICAELADRFMDNGDEVRIAYGRMDEVPEKYQKIAVRIGIKLDLIGHILQTRINDRHGFGSLRATKRFLKWAEEYQPDLVWLHNIHGYYINVELLFAWIKEHPELQVRWTLHDCWAFTGHCAYFTAAKCEQWKTGCTHCPQLKEYPACYGSGAVKRNYERKRTAFTGVANMTLVTPSQWLAGLVKQSFLKEYPIEVQYNKIDTGVFKPTKSNFREKYGLLDKKIVLGVASTWDKRKGLSDLCQLARMLDERYAVVAVGLTKRQIGDLPRLVRNVKVPGPAEMRNRDLAIQRKLLADEDASLMNCVVTAANANGDAAILPGAWALYWAIIGEEYGGSKDTEGTCRVIGLPKTNHPEELAGIYTAADVFVNPTYEDNYPTVNLEARACGTRVITYDTGGCRETLMHSGEVQGA